MAAGLLDEVEQPQVSASSNPDGQALKFGSRDQIVRKWRVRLPTRNRTLQGGGGLR
jgi:hypothetical protein